MAEQGIETIIEKVVSKVLEGYVPQLRDELVRRVAEQVRGELGNASPAAPSGAASDLLQCVNAIHAGTTQKEVLRALLDGTVHYSGRSALFVMKGGAATGWEGRGFSDSGDVKDFALNVGTPVVSNALQSRIASSGKMDEVDPQLATQFGTSADGHGIVIPLIVKEKVAALVYADAGAAGTIDTASLELLVKATSAWLEVALLRKQTGKDLSAEASETERAQPVPVQASPAISDPFAGHAPLHTAKPEFPMAAAAAASAGSQGAERPPANASAEDTDVHGKAQRFARLLVDEIKLYNQAKVAEGRKNKDLYQRLKEDIEKSRSTYLKRYGNTSAASGDYFNSELVRSLAEDDVSIMGAGFRR